MNFLWDIALVAKRQGWKEEELFFCQAEDYSPFYEQAFSCVNEKEVPGKEIELNLLFRLAPIFQWILAEEDPVNPQFNRYLVDAALHMILYTDLRHGLSKRDIYIRKVREELESGVFWKDGADTFCRIPLEQRNRLAALVLTQMQTGSSLMLFRRGVRVLFPDAVIYQLRKERREIPLYLKESRTEGRERMLNLLQDMFLPVSFHLRVFWQYHFGIIGVEDTMKIDEIAIY
ncbi:MAG: hypothetical protein J1E64_07170 [Acetatifactor sp.]|nr:hypothetical protein [Acetatifactor sp.]